MNHRKFWGGFFLFPALAAVMAAASLLLFYRSGELASVAEIAQAQLERGCLYGSALESLTFRHKQALYARKRPDVVVIGSSRAMQFPQNGFSAPFLNLGGMASGVEELAFALDALLLEAKPKAAMIVADFWWLDTKIEEPFLRHSHGRHKEKITLSLNTLAKPWIWLVENKLPPGTLLQSGFSSHCDMGLSARIYDDGFDASGVYHYTSFLSGARKAEDQKFAKTLSAAAHNGYPFDGNWSISKDRLEKLFASVRRLEEVGIKTLIVFPPLAPTVFENLTDRQKDFMAEAAADLARTGAIVFDFQDPATIGATDCEFIDGIHGGQVVALRMVKEISASGLGETFFLDAEKSDQLTRTHAGKFIAGESDEIDALDIGCKK